MFEFLAFDTSTIVGALIIILVLTFLRFGNMLVDILLSHTSSPVEAIEKSIPEQE